MYMLYSKHVYMDDTITVQLVSILYIFFDMFETLLLNIWLFQLDMEKTGRWVWYRKQKLFHIYRLYACWLTLGFV